MNIPDALKSLRLATVEMTGEGVSLVSLAYRCALADANSGLTSFDDVPDLVMTEEIEQHIKEELGLTHEGWPGWDALFAYLDRHPELLPSANGDTDRLVAYAESLGLSSSNLDMLVHDLAQEIALPDLNMLEGQQEQEEHIGAQQATASAINNGGLAEQIAFLLQHNSAEEVKELLDGLRTEEAKDSTSQEADGNTLPCLRSDYMEYLVTWTINVEADSPLAAAEHALAAMQDPDTQATFFCVKEQAEGGATFEVDLRFADQQAQVKDVQTGTIRRHSL
jgi:hypothetical protein